ncbi:MAG: hypothetical protein ACSLEY_03630 [Candidatus Saccharimonadales bacterium]
MSEQPTTIRPDETRLDDGDGFDLHASNLPRAPFVRAEKPEVQKSLSELAVEGIKVRTTNLVWTRTTEQNINGSWLGKDAA